MWAVERTRWYPSDLDEGSPAAGSGAKCACAPSVESWLIAVDGSFDGGSAVVGAARARLRGGSGEGCAELDAEVGVLSLALRAARP